MQIKLYMFNQGHVIANHSICLATCLFTSHLFYLSIDNPVVNTDCPPHRIASPGFAASHKYSTAPCVHNIYTHTRIYCANMRAP